MPTQRIAVRIPRNQTDPDAQAFITAAGITDTTQKSAINTLVVNLKAYGIWTKMKALYPFVGGTAAQHKFNLKDPRDLDAAFRLVFNGGWTHSANGALPNGLNGYADTKFNDLTHFTSNTNGHISAYIRTDFPVGGNFETIIGCSTDNNGTRILTRRGTGLDYLTLTDNFSAQAAGNYSDKLKGQYLLTKDGTNKRYFKNSTLLHTAANGTNGAANRNIYLGAENYPVVSYYSNRELAFASIGDGLTNTEAANFYTAVQAFQTTLGRSIGTQTVSDADAQAFIDAAQITDQVQATAINNLVVGLKADSIWTKMKAVYPFVGGTSTSHKFNLKDPRNLDVAFRLQFNGGWTHSANGALPNGTNAFANTYLTPSTAMPSGGDSLHYYSRTNSTTTGDNLIAGELSGPYRALILRGKDSGGIGSYFTTNPSSAYQSASQTDASRDARGLFGGTSNGTNTYFYLNGVQLANNTSAQTYTARYSNVLFIGARRGNTGGAVNFTNKECAYASIGEGLTTTDMLNYNTRVQAFQTTLGRQV